MDELVVEILFGASAIVAGLTAWGKLQAQRLISIATSVCLAALAFFVQVTDFLE